MEARILRGGLHLAHYIPLRAHIDGIPGVEGRVVHGKAVVVLRHRQHKFGTGPGEQVSPGLRLKFFAPEHGDEVLVAKVLLIAEIFHMVGKFLPLGVIHIPGVPLVAEGRHGIDAPVDENAQFPPGIPGRRLMGRQRRPVVLVVPLLNDPADLTQICRFFHMLLPFPSGYGFSLLYFVFPAPSIHPPNFPFPPLPGAATVPIIQHHLFLQFPGSVFAISAQSPLALTGAL